MLDTKTRVKLSCCIALAFGTAVLAAQQTGTPAGRERGDLDKIRKVSTLIGTHVVNRANTTLADVRDLVLSSEGDVKYAVLGFGGVVGVGFEYGFAPNWSAGVEYDHMFMGTQSNGFTTPAGAFAGTDNIKQDVDLFTARINYRFGGPIVARY